MKQSSSHDRLFAGEVDAKQITPLSGFSMVRAHVDFAFKSTRGDLVLVGWIFDPEEQVSGISVLLKKKEWLRKNKMFMQRPLEHERDQVQCVRVMRPDVSSAMQAVGQARSDNHGLVLVVPDYPKEGRLALALTDGRFAVLPFQLLADPDKIEQAIRRCQPHSGNALSIAMEKAIGTDSAGKVKKRTAWMGRGNLQEQLRTMATAVDLPATMIAAIDWAYPLGAAGVLIFGWQIFPKQKPLSIRLRSTDGGSVDISDRMSPLVRVDVSQAYLKRFPDMTDWCGFICLAPLPVKPGESCAVNYDFGELGEVWLKVPATISEKSDREMIKDILRGIPATERLRSVMFDIFSKGLGSAIESISRRATFVGAVQERQFGSSPDRPEVSIIVPLYGRFDFLRHQLAHFCDDPDFDTADLIYVVDDPGIISQTIDLAARCHELFAMPFRVVHYQQNLGFAGANNVGVRLAWADTVLLLNSDIIPQQAGWLSTLRHALESLPQAGAVGPLLQYSDFSVQHAGMRPKYDPYFPGFLLNTHPGKGQVWYGPDVPSEQPLLTAAALMMRKQDYLDVGGLDEGYVIGDFEDSDLCLALRKAGKRLWLVPEAKLWHLERQSQHVEGMTGYRQLLTLYNGWRYQQKIHSGQIADPTRFEG